MYVLPKAKLEDLKSRAVDPQAIPAIIPIQGTEELNSNMWLDLQKALQGEYIHFLIDELNLETLMEEDLSYFDLSSEEKAIIKLPYVHTLEMIGEAISLNQTWNGGKVKLHEPTTTDATKDKIVAVSYCNYIATLLENKYAIQNQNDTSMIDIEQLVF